MFEPQPIATAPLNGKVIFVGVGSSCGVQVFWHEPAAKGSPGAWCYAHPEAPDQPWHEIDFAPTHWSDSLDAFLPSPPTTDTLVERVARALSEADGYPPDELVGAIGDGVGYPVWRQYRDSAQAAIAVVESEVARLSMQQGEDGRSELADELAELLEYADKRDWSQPNQHFHISELISKHRATILAALRDAPEPANQSIDRAGVLEEAARRIEQSAENYRRAGCVGCFEAASVADHLAGVVRALKDNPDTMEGKHERGTVPYDPEQLGSEIG